MPDESFDRQLNRMKNHFDLHDKKLSELTEKMRASSQHLAGLKREARHPRFATEVEAEPDTKTRKRTEDATVDPAKHVDNSSSARVDHDPLRLTSFGDESTEPPALPCRDDTLIDEGTEAPKPCLSRARQ